MLQDRFEKDVNWMRFPDANPMVIEREREKEWEIARIRWESKMDRTAREIFIVPTYRYSVLIFFQRILDPRSKSDRIVSCECDVTNRDWTQFYKELALIYGKGNLDRTSDESCSRDSRDTHKQMAAIFAWGQAAARGRSDLWLRSRCIFMHARFIFAIPMRENISGDINSAISIIRIYAPPHDRFVSADWNVNGKRISITRGERCVFRRAFFPPRDYSRAAFSIFSMATMELYSSIKAGGAPVPAKNPLPLPLPCSLFMHAYRGANL